MLIPFICKLLYDLEENIGRRSEEIIGLTPEGGEGG